MEQQNEIEDNGNNMEYEITGVGEDSDTHGSSFEENKKRYELIWRFANL